MPVPWPALEVARDQPTFATLHLVCQMLGKLRIAHAPWLNHGWHATLHPRMARVPNMARSSKRRTSRTRLCTQFASSPLYDDTGHSRGRRALRARTAFRRS